MCHDHSYQQLPPWLERAWITAEQQQTQARDELLRILVGRRQLMRQALQGGDIHWPAAAR